MIEPSVKKQNVSGEESSFNIILAFDWALGANARPKGVTKVMQFKEFASFMNITKGLVTKTNLDKVSILGGSLVLFNRFSRAWVIYS